MRSFKCTALAICLFSLTALQAANTPQLRPVKADYNKVAPAAVQHAPSPCGLLLMKAPPPLSPTANGLVVLGTKPCGENKVGIWALQFENEVPSDSFQFSMKSFAPGDLKDTVNSEVKTGDYLKKLLSPDRIAPGSSIIVSKDTLIDTSLLIKYSDSRHFIVEQVSDPKRLQANLDYLRDRPFSQKLTIFDFSPKSSGMLGRIGRSISELPQWKAFSTKIDKASNPAISPDLRGEQTKAALFARLSDSNGGIVVIYGHSDGTSIWLETEQGVQTLSESDLLKQFGGEKRILCPVILANCETKATIAKAFLEAGCPFVATSDSPLPLDEIAAFVKLMTKLVHEDGKDVIDAYFAAQASKGPYRMHPIASAREMPRVYVLRDNRIVCL